MKVLFVRSGNSGEDPLSTNQGKSLIKKGVDVSFFDIKGNGLLGYLSNLKALRRHMLITNPDIIHCHYSLSCFLTSMTLTKIPIVASLMGTDILQAGKIRIWLVRFFSKISWSAIIVKSKEIFEKLKVAKAYTVPNGVTFEDFNLVEKSEAQRLLGWDNEKKHILFCSDPARREKNFRLAEEGIKLFEKQFPNFIVHFLNGVDYTKMVWYYCAADVFLMTSLYEGSPNTIKEAMVCNCPIVTTDVGDVREVIKDTQGAFLTDFNAESVAECLERAVLFNSRTDGRRKMERLNSGTIAAKIIDIYNNVV